MNRNSKKGFTIVELIIVIAVIAVLAAVLIPTFSNLIQKANEAKDTALVSNLNKAVAMDTTSHDTMYDVLKVAEDVAGINVAKINAAANSNEILWDSVNKCFVYRVGEEIKYIPDTKTKDVEGDYDYWKISSDQADIKEGKYSIYWNGENLTDTVTVKTGFDAGEAEVANIEYTGVESPKVANPSVTIRTNGGALAINAPQDTVAHYGKASGVQITAVYGNSYHEHGEVVGDIVITKGRIELAATAQVGTVLVASAATGDVKVDVVSGAQVGTVAPTTAEAKKYIDADTSIPAESKYTGVVQVNEDYAGGLGTVNSPYLIATAEQLTKIINAKAGYRNFKLIKDIDMSVLTPIEYDGSKLYIGKEYQGGSPYLYGHVIDGNGYSIFLADDVSFCGALRNSTIIKNVTFHMNGRAAIALEADGKGTLENVVVKSEKGIVLANNEAVFVRKGLNSSAYIVIKNCKNYADVTSAISQTNYNGIIVGCYTAPAVKSTLRLNVDGFENYGNITSGKIAIIGNVYQVNSETTLKLTLKNVKNYVIIRSFYAPANSCVATNISNEIIVSVDGSNRPITDNILSGVVYGSADDTIAISKNTNGTLSITASNNTSVSYYIVSMGIYTKISTEGTSGTNQVAVCERIEKFEGTKNTTMKVLGFVDGSRVGSSTALSGLYSSRGESTIKMATLDGNEYYVVNIDGEKVDGIVYAQNRMITVTAYDAADKPISSATVIK